MFSITCANLHCVPVVVLASLVMSSPSIAADLSPYSLPSQQRYVPETRMQQQQTPPAIGIREAYYQQFAQKASALQPNQRADLQRSFTQQRDQAYAAGKVDEAQHYNRLVQILSSIK